MGKRAKIRIVKNVLKRKKPVSKKRKTTSLKSTNSPVENILKQKTYTENRNTFYAGNNQITAGAVSCCKLNGKPQTDEIQMQANPAPTQNTTSPPKLSKETVALYDTIDCGGFLWQIRWKLDKPTTKGGYVVQKIGSWVNVKDNKNKPVRVQDRVKSYNPKNYPFWEAWKIEKKQAVTGHNIDDSYAWLQGVGEGTKGFIEDRGHANYYDGLELPSSFKVKRRSPAGLLPMTKSDPNLTGGSGPLIHSLRAEWNCCPGSTSHKTRLTTY